MQSRGAGCWLAHRKNVTTFDIFNESDRGYLLMSRLSTLLNAYMFNLRVQEGSHWDFTLFRGSKVIDDFSTLPQYWDPDDVRLQEAKKGHPEVVAKAWGIPFERVAKYMVNWGYIEPDEDGPYQILLRDKAYETDKYNYGDIWQSLDFLHAIGGNSSEDLDNLDDFSGLTCEFIRLGLPPLEQLRAIKN
jgi:hypothetical protein